MKNNQRYYEMYIIVLPTTVTSWLLNWRGIKQLLGHSPFCRLVKRKFFRFSFKLKKKYDYWLRLDRPSVRVQHLGSQPKGFCEILCKRVS